MVHALANSKKLKKKIESLRVLVVDDQPEVRALIRDMLAEIGVIRTFEAANGIEAIEFMQAGGDVIDFIICDWNMPAMSGIDFLKQIRAVHPDLPFLMVTGKSDKDSVLEAKDSGVSAYIRKPFSHEQLEIKMKALLMPA